MQGKRSLLRILELSAAREAQCSKGFHTIGLQYQCPPMTSRFAVHLYNAKLRTDRRYHLFWALHVAHALIYGVIAVLWRFLLRQPNDAGSGGAAASHIILTTSARQEMSRRVQPGILKSTGCISGKIPDVTKCVFLEPELALHQRGCLSEHCVQDGKLHDHEPFDCVYASSVPLLAVRLRRT
jgi:hypothetical protein